MPEQLSLGLDVPLPRLPRAQRRRAHHARVKGDTWAELEAMEAHAKRQDDLVLDAFKRLPEAAYTPSGLLTALEAEGHKLLITSVRRALTNLTRAGKLTHITRVRMPGPHGRPETMWELAR